MGHLSLKRLNAEGLKGELLYWGTWVMKRRKALETGICLYEGTVWATWSVLVYWGL
jgi:hypothetical protein